MTRALARFILDAVVGLAKPEPLVARLFTNDVKVDRLGTARTLIEAVGWGYSAQALDARGWLMSDDMPPKITGPLCMFQFVGPLGDVYGYYLTHRDSGMLVHVERFEDAPYEIRNPNDTITIVPTIAFDGASARG